MSDDALTSSAVLMIRPASFGHNAQTAPSNVYQRPAVRDTALHNRLAIIETEQLADQLVSAGVEVVLLNDTVRPAKPDAVFPNNWVSFHADGQVILYPMQALNRRPERRLDLLDALTRDHGFRISSQLDLSWLETRGFALEGTGSLVFDRGRALVYAALSSRTHVHALTEFLRQTGYRSISFTTADRGQPVYHTNVMLALGTRFAVICDEVIVEPLARAAVLKSLAVGGREIIRIRRDQMAGFAANLLEISTPTGPLIALSASALSALDASQRRRLEACGQLLVQALPTIESAGGSLRCMLAEIFLPRLRSGPG